MNANTLLTLIGEAQDAHVRSAWQTRKRLPLWTKGVAAVVCACLLMAGMMGVSVAALQCYLVDTGNWAAISGLSISRVEDAALWNRGMFQSETASPTVTVSFGGKTYTGVYCYSLCTAVSGGTADYYRPQGADWAEFSVDAQSGALRSIDLISQGFLEEQGSLPPMDADAIEEKAKRLAAQYIDTDDYVMRRTGVNRDEENGLLLYTYEFVRVVGGYDTTDKLQLMLTDRGGLLQIGGLHSRWVDDHGLALMKLRIINPEKMLRQVLGDRSFRIRKCTYGITPEGIPMILVDCALTGKFGEAVALFVIQ